MTWERKQERLLVLVSGLIRLLLPTRRSVDFRPRCPSECWFDFRSRALRELPEEQAVEPGKDWLLEVLRRTEWEVGRSSFERGCP